VRQDGEGPASPAAASSAPRVSLKAKWRGLLRALRHGDLGSRGEALAADFLRDKGYEILARNYRVRGGEADLVARADGKIVVVEVKARRSLRFGTPAEAVDRRKTRRVLRAGRSYCRAHGLSLALLRGDVVTVAWPGEGGEPVITHWPSVLAE